MSGAVLKLHLTHRVCMAKKIPAKKVARYYITQVKATLNPEKLDIVFQRTYNIHINSGMLHLNLYVSLLIKSAKSFETCHYSR